MIHCDSAMMLTFQPLEKRIFVALLLLEHKKLPKNPLLNIPSDIPGLSVGHCQHVSKGQPSGLLLEAADAGQLLTTSPPFALCTHWTTMPRLLCSQEGTM